MSFFQQSSLLGEVEYNYTQQAFAETIKFLQL